jgi:hypothetical protein
MGCGFESLAFLDLARRSAAGVKASLRTAWKRWAAWVRVCAISAASSRQLVSSASTRATIAACSANGGGGIKMSVKLGNGWDESDGADEVEAIAKLRNCHKRTQRNALFCNSLSAFGFQTVRCCSSRKNWAIALKNTAPKSWARFGPTLCICVSSARFAGHSRAI